MNRKKRKTKDMAEEKDHEKSQVIEDEAPEKNKEEAAEQQPQDAETGEPEAAAEEGEADEAAKLSAELDTLKATIEKMQKDYLLLMAEFDNFRKRTNKEKAEIIKNGAEKTILAILPILDDMERAISNMHKSNDADALREGVELINNKFLKTLSKEGLSKIETENADFNTDYHEAIAMLPAADEQQKGKIIDCVQTGYLLNDKVIRHAKVAVAQ